MSVVFVTVIVPRYFGLGCGSLYSPAFDAGHKKGIFGR
jgi:hypothetical protein